MTIARIRKLFKHYLPWIIIGIGIILRLRQYFFDRSLWLDEAFLARNILERSFIGLLRPLQYGQNAPISFLLLSKLATVIGGNTSIALRFFPLVFGIIALFLFYFVARRILKTPGMMVALTFFSFATPMVYYSTEFKQYMCDVLATLVLWYFFLVARPKHKVWFVLLGMVMMWFSHASVFILAGLGIAYPEFLTYAVPFWVASFGLNYLFFLQYTLPASVAAIGNTAFLTFPWQSYESGKTFIVSIGRVFGFFVDLDTTWVHAGVMLLGYAGIARKNIRTVTVLGLPVILLLIATGFQKYPFVPRLLLFLVPSFYIAIGAGADMLFSWSRQIAGRMGVIIATIILLPLLLWGTVPSAAQALVLPIKVEELKTVLAYLSKHYEPGDVIYLYYAAEAPFKFYAPEFGLDKVPVIVGISSRSDVIGYEKDVAKLKGQPRVWAVFSHIYKQSLFGEDRYIAGFLDEIGKRLDYYPQVGASAYLYDLR